MTNGRRNYNQVDQLEKFRAASGNQRRVQQFDQSKFNQYRTLGLQSAREAITGQPSNIKLDFHNGVVPIPQTRRSNWTDYQINYFKQITANVIINGQGVNKLDEWIFYNSFLAMFYRIITGNDLFDHIDYDYDLLLQKWLYIAESPYKGVDIINQEGQVLYTTPPLFMNANQFKRFYKNKQNNEILSNIENVQKYMGEVGYKHIEKFLYSEKIERVSPEERKAYADDWEKIFARYGLIDKEYMKEGAEVVEDIAGIVYVTKGLGYNQDENKSGSFKRETMYINVPGYEEAVGVYMEPFIKAATARKQVEPPATTPANEEETKQVEAPDSKKVFEYESSDEDLF